jgi:DNA-directed RNA polymerase sigma subunit (sigma70/sigma32)
MTNNIETYLREIGRTPLLSAEQEVKLANQVQSMLHLLDRERPTPEEQPLVTS